MYRCLKEIKFFVAVTFMDLTLVNNSLLLIFTLAAFYSLCARVGNFLPKVVSTI